MKFIKYIFIIFLLVNTIKVKAICEVNEFNRLKKYAENVEFIYDLVEGINDNGEFDVSFNITATNLNAEVRPLIIKNYYLGDYQEFKYNDQKEYTINNFSMGDRITITFKGYVKNECSGETVYTKVISLPYYNYFYMSDECIEHRDFEYCKSKLLDKNISSREFYDSYNKYLLKDNTQNEIGFNQKYNYLYILLFIIIIIGMIMIIMNYKKKKDVI